MKHLEEFIRTLALTAFTMLAMMPQGACGQTPADLDSIEISLVTCSPHEEVYSLYGHTALRCNNLKTGADLMFNYGVFDFNKPHFVLRFVFGKTDYELGVAPTDAFCDYYRQWGSQVTEQVLNLTNEDKALILRALSLNLQPGNRVYRYNFFYDNCSTRPRDIIANNLNGEIVYADRSSYRPSYREMIHELNAHHPWAAMGNDLLLGAKADLKTTRAEQEFLPKNLQHDFDHAQIFANGSYRPLVSERRTLVPPGVQMVEEEFPLSPTACAVLLLLACTGVFLTEWRRKRCMVWFDAMLMLCTGVAGCIILLMFFSEHPTTSTNLQILLLNPLHLFFIPAVVKRRKTAMRYVRLMTILTLLFLLGRLLQDYAEGMVILALCLLTRYWSHFRNDK